MMLTEKDFIRELTKELSLRLPDAPVAIRPIAKANRPVCDALLFIKENAGITPVLPVKELYRMYRDNGSLAHVCETVVDSYQTALQSQIPSLLTVLQDFSAVWDRLCCRLVSYEGNQEYLKTVPHTRFLDLAVIYYLSVDCNPRENGITVITNYLLNYWGLETETLHAVAGVNTLRLYPSRIETMQKLLLRIMEEIEIPKEMLALFPEPALPFYVLTASGSPYGAVGLLDQPAIAGLARQLEKDLYVIPSSCCEVLLAPVIDDVTSDDLKRVLKDLNRTDIQKEDRLSDSIYRYRRDTDALEIYA